MMRRTIEDLNFGISKRSFVVPATPANLTFEERLQNSFDCTAGQVYLKYLKYFNIVGQVHSIAVTGKRNAILRIWCGEKMGPEHMAEQRKPKLFRLHKEIFQRWMSPPEPSIAKAVKRLGIDCLIEVDVYDEHKESLNFLKSGDFVVLYNVHYGKSMASEYFVLHHGKRFNRGVFRVPDDYDNPDFQKLRRTLTKQVEEAQNDEYTIEFVENDRVPCYMPKMSDIEFPEEIMNSDINFVKPNNRIVIGDNLIAVDYFTMTGNTKYLFLTHAHSDHTKNLSSKWRRKVFCSDKTAAILPSLTRCRGDGGIDPELLYPLELGIPHEFDGFKVTLFDANHCMGAVMYLFEGRAIPGYRVLCTGDFRCDSELVRKLEEDETFKMLKGVRLSAIYFDNTYLHVNKRFPDRNKASEMLFQEVAKHPDKNIYFPMHRLGREELIENLSRQLQEPIKVYDLKHEVMKSLGCYSSYGRERGRQLVVVERNKWRPEEALENSVVFDITMMTQTLASEHRLRQLGKTSHVVHIPFSDHSSRYEIVEFLRHLNFGRLIPIAKRIDLRVLKFLLSFSTCTKNQKIGRSATPPRPNKLMKEMPREVLIDDTGVEEENEVEVARTSNSQTTRMEPPKKRMTVVTVERREEPEVVTVETPEVQEIPVEKTNISESDIARNCQRRCPEGYKFVDELPPPTNLEEAIKWIQHTPTMQKIDS